MKKFFEGIVLMLLFAVVLPGTKVYAADDGRIAKGVTIGGIDVSGLDSLEAEREVSAYVNELSAKELTLHVDDGKELTFTGEDIGLYWSNTGVVDEALALGHRGNVIERYKSLKDLENNGQSYDISFGFDDEALRGVVDRCADAYDQETINYTLSRTENGFAVTEGQTGYLVDREESFSIVNDFLQNSIYDDSVINLSVKADEPKGSEEELSKVKDVLGTFTTSFSSSGSDRSKNVINGCRLINGATVYPGDEFSVLDAITPFTEANGYYPAASYLNGTVVDSLGGGICQVSTTLYNAVLRAELDVTERHNHSMIVGYVEPSMDAAIAESGGKNFKFVNSTDSPIYIEGITSSDKHITFTIYGVETRPSDHKVSYESEVLSQTPPSPDRFVTDSSLPIGSVSTQSAHAGYKAQLWKIVTDNGETTREVINSSSYTMVPKIVTVGIGGGDANQIAQIQTAIATGDTATVKAVAGALAAAKSAEGTENAEAAAQAVNDAVDQANAMLQQREEMQIEPIPVPSPQPEPQPESAQG